MGVQRGERGKHRQRDRETENRGAAGLDTGNHPLILRRMGLAKRLHWPAGGGEQAIFASLVLSLCRNAVCYGQFAPFQILDLPERS